MASRGDGDQSPFATFANDSFCFPFKSTFDLLHFSPFPSAPPPSAQHLEMVWPSFSQFVHIIFSALFSFELVGNGDLDFSLLCTIYADYWFFVDPPHLYHSSPPHH